MQAVLFSAKKPFGVTFSPLSFISKKSSREEHLTTWPHSPPVCAFIAAIFTHRPDANELATARLHATLNHFALSYELKIDSSRTSLSPLTFGRKKDLAH